MCPTATVVPRGLPQVGSARDRCLDSPCRGSSCAGGGGLRVPVTACLAVGSGGVYPRYRAGQGPLPVPSTRVEGPRYPPGDPAAPGAGVRSPPHP